MKAALLVTLVAALALAASAASTDYTPDQIKAMMDAPADNSGAKLTVTKIDPSKVAGPAAPLEQCWHLEGGWHTWGTWPADQKLREVRDWCAQYVGGPQTRRTTHVFAESPYCAYSNLYAYLRDGGNGYTWATVHSGGHFFCRPWNTDRWIEIACNTWGNCSWVDWELPGRRT